MTKVSDQVAPLIVAEFPDLRSAFEDETIRGLIHLEFSELARYTQVAKGRSDWATYERALRLHSRLFLEGDEKVRNAAAVSFLEKMISMAPEATSLELSLSGSTASVVPTQRRLWPTYSAIDGLRQPPMIQPW